MPGEAAGARLLVDAHEWLALDVDWQAAATAPGALSDCAALDQLSWRTAAVPGTAAGVLQDAGEWRPGQASDLDAQDWWFRTAFVATPPAPGEQVVLVLEGLATVAEVYLNGRHVLDSESMFAAHTLDVGELLEADNRLAICCRALAPLLSVPRRPRARWRTRVAPGGLRFFRTMILGRAPGFAPGPAAVGPWRPVRLERRRRVIVQDLVLRPSVSRADGILDVHAGVRALPDAASVSAAELDLRGPSGHHRVALSVTAQADGVRRLSGRLRVPEVSRWWPHTHGSAPLHDVRMALTVDGEHVGIDAGRVGFRELTAGPRRDWDASSRGLDLHVNGQRVFIRGAVWTPIDPVGLAPSPSQLRDALVCVRDAGMNMLRVVGTSTYESATFHDLCDELGLLVWQDFMFANFDYPLGDPHFRTLVLAEIAQQLAAVGGRPSLAVLCGNSEVEQQVAMLGQDPMLGRGELFGELLPAMIEAAGIDAPYLPSAPCGGDVPFRTDRGVANYFGVGGYRRPLRDAREAQVRFASECLAISNVPDELALAQAPHDQLGPGGVPRDVGSDWDFADVRDHYLALCFDVDAAALRSADPQRYLELSRAVSGELMAHVFGEWRRRASPCGGGLVLWLRDLRPGAGWGVLDHQGAPKVAFHHLRRALAPVAVWLTDEGLNGVDVHLANDGPQVLRAQLRVALYRDLEQPLHELRRSVELPAHGDARFGVEELLGRFVDASWSYRFGPAAHDAIVASLERTGETEAEIVSQAFHFRARPPLELEAAEQLGLRAQARILPAGDVELEVTSRRLVHGVRIHADAYRASDDAFSVEPGGRRRVRLTPMNGAGAPVGALTALNLAGSLAIEVRGT